MENRHVIVLGGGILGVSTATHLARGGAQVTLVTEAELCSGASGHSLSWLNSAGNHSEAYHRLRTLGIDRYRTMFAADPTRDWLRFDGGVWWTTPASTHSATIRHAHQVQRGYASHLVSRADLTAHHLAPGPRDQLAIHNPGEGWVSLPHLIDALATEFAELGGQLVTGAGRCSVEAERENGRASGVRSENGQSWHGDAVVVACGSHTPAVVAELGVHIPDGSVPSMLVITEPARAKARTVLNTPRAAMRPNPGETFAIDHSWYEDRIVEHEDGTWSIDEAIVNELVGEASALLDDAEPLIPASWKLGRKPIPGDGQPVFGELATVPGCHVAFTHSGATLGLIAGELTAHEVLTGDRHPLLAEFRPERFSPTHRGEV